MQDKGEQGRYQGQDGQSWRQIATSRRLYHGDVCFGLVLLLSPFSCSLARFLFYRITAPFFCLLNVCLQCHGRNDGQGQQLTVNSLLAQIVAMMTVAVIAAAKILREENSRLKMRTV